MIIVNGSKPSTIITKRSILDVAAALDPFLILCNFTLLQFIKTEENVIRTPGIIVCFQDCLKSCASQKQPSKL